MTNMYLGNEKRNCWCIGHLLTSKQADWGFFQVNPTTKYLSHKPTSFWAPVLSDTRVYQCSTYKYIHNNLPWKSSLPVIFILACCLWTGGRSLILGYWQTVFWKWSSTVGQREKKVLFWCWGQYLGTSLNCNSFRKLCHQCVHLQLLLYYFLTTTFLTMRATRS